MKIPEQILIIATRKSNPLKNVHGCFAIMVTSGLPRRHTVL